MPFDDDDLELAFQLGVIDRLAGADLATTRSEQSLIDRWFPPATLEHQGFVDRSGARTARFADALAAALAELPSRLHRARKLALLEVCFRIAVADREFRIGEGTVLLEASRQLGLSDEDFDRFLEGRPGATGMTAALIDG